MAKVPNQIVVLSCGLIALNLSCGKKGGSSSSGSSGPGTGTTYATAGSPTVHLAQSFNALTPSAFQAAKTSLALDGTATTDPCASLSGTDRTACQAVGTINTIFFQSGPTVIRDRLGSFDSALNGTIENLSSAYVPCLDSSRTVAKAFKVQPSGLNGQTTPPASRSITYPPFALTTVPLKSTFKAGYALDTGASLQLSCFQPQDTTSGKSGIGDGYGYNAATNTWSLYEQDPSGLAMYGTSVADAINMWFFIGGTTGVSTVASQQAAGEASGGTSFYTGSTGVVNITSNPATGLIGISMVGAGLGIGCGAQVIMNSSTLYFKGNLNNYLACYDADVQGQTSVGGQPTHDASLDDVSLCMDVSGNSATAAANGMQDCVASGLVSLDDNGNIVAPFTSAGLANLTANPNSGVAGALYARAWEGAAFMNGTDLSALPLLAPVVMGPSDVVQVAGYSANTYTMKRTTAAADQSTSVTAACNATGAALQSTMNESFELQVADITAALAASQQATAAATASTPVTGTTVASTLNAAFSNTGATQAFIQIPLLGQKGATFVGTFTGTATVKLDGKTVGTASLALPAASGAMSALASVKLSSANVVTSTSKFDVTVTGTLSLNCASSNAMTRTVAAKPGAPTFVYYVSQKQQSK